MSNHTMKNLFFSSLRSKQSAVRIITLVLFVSVISFVLYQGTKAMVAIDANGEQLELATHAKTVEEVLASQNITVSEYDKVSPSLDTEITSGMEISWEQAEEIFISVDGNQSSIWTTEKRVKNILEEANIEVTEQDSLSLALDTEVGADNKIDIQKAFQLTLVDGLEERQVWSTSTTVANFLKEQGITLGELDRVEKKMEDVITPNDKVAVVRVEKVTDVVEESIDFATEKKHDSSILKGKEKVVTTGEKGTMERTYELVKENGQVVTKTLQAEKVIEKPTTKVVAVGTKVITATVSRSNTNASKAAETTKAPATTKAAAPSQATNTAASSSEAPSGGKEFYVSATAYTASCTGCSGITATGINLNANPNMKVIAVDPSVIPLGSKVWVEGYGHAIAGDTGGAIKGNKIDVFVASHSQAIAWGRKKVRIKVL